MFLIVDNVRTVECPVVDCSRRPDQPHKMHGCRLHSEYRCIPRHSKIKSNKKNQDYGDVCVRETQQGRLTIMRKQFFNAKGNLGKKCFQLAFESVSLTESTSAWVEIRTDQSQHSILRLTSVAVLEPAYRMTPFLPSPPVLNKSAQLWKIIVHHLHFRRHRLT